jgi:hypothetical protein
VAVDDLGARRCRQVRSDLADLPVSEQYGVGGDGVDAVEHIDVMDQRRCPCFL